MNLRDCGISSLLIILFCVMLSSCNERTDATQNAPTPTPGVEEPDVMQSLLQQNAELIEANKTLMAELQNMKTTNSIPNAQPQPMMIPETPNTSSDELWRQIMEIANKSLIEDEQKQKLVNTGSKLISGLNIAIATQAANQEAVDTLEMKAQEDENGDIALRLADAKNRLAAAQAEIEQYQRDLAALIEPYKRLQPPQLQPIMMPPENQTSYDGLSISPLAEVTDDHQFIVKISFVVTNTMNKPRLATVTTHYNLNTMQTVVKLTPTPTPTAQQDEEAESIGEEGDEENEEIDDDMEEDFASEGTTPIIDPHTIQYEYPAAFLTQIHRATRQAWRSGLLRWNRKLTTEELCLFVQLTNRKDYTPITLNEEEIEAEE